VYRRLHHLKTNLALSLEKFPLPRQHPRPASGEHGTFRRLHKLAGQRNLKPAEVARTIVTTAEAFATP
jgi:hypothetical protein